MSNGSSIFDDSFESLFGGEPAPATPPLPATEVVADEPEVEVVIDNPKSDETAAMVDEEWEISEGLKEVSNEQAEEAASEPTKAVEETESTEPEPLPLVGNDGDGEEASEAAEEANEAVEPEKAIAEEILPTEETEPTAEETEPEPANEVDHELRRLHSDLLVKISNARMNDRVAIARHEAAKEDAKLAKSMVEDCNARTMELVDQLLQVENDLNEGMPLFDGVKPAAAEVDETSEPEGGGVKKEGSVKLYRPSNGMEGEGFMAQFCDRCERRGNSEDGHCQIIGDTMAFDIDSPEYPREWTYDSDGDPTCTAFKLEGAVADDESNQGEGEEGVHSIDEPTQPAELAKSPAKRGMEPQPSPPVEIDSIDLDADVSETVVRIIAENQVFDIGQEFPIHEVRDGETYVIDPEDGQEVRLEDSEFVVLGVDDVAAAERARLEAESNVDHDAVLRGAKPDEFENMPIDNLGIRSTLEDVVKEVNEIYDVGMLIKHYQANGSFKGLERVGPKKSNDLVAAISKTVRFFE